MIYDVVIVGGGAAGFFTAINIAELHPKAKILIAEKSNQLLNKVKISGGGRCNVTHNCFEINELVKFYPRGQKELIQVFNVFQPKDTINWFQNKGIKIVKEADGRMFPSSNTSQTIVDCFLDLCQKYKIQIYTQFGLIDFEKNEYFFNLKFDNSEVLKSKNIVFCSGSNHFIWNLLKSKGHKIIEPVPSLFTFTCNHPILKELSGISFEKIKINIEFDKNEIKKYQLNPKQVEQSGALLITHKGLSGPAVLKLSSVAARFLNSLKYKFFINIDFLPNLTYLEIEDLIKNLKKTSRKKIINENMFNFSNRFWENCLSFLKIENKNIADLSSKDIQELMKLLKNFKIEVLGKNTFKEEFVTAGGVDLKEINFKTMESKLIEKLFLAGEVLNIDALTGGFNFQAAWSESFVISQNIKI